MKSSAFIYKIILRISFAAVLLAGQSALAIDPAPGAACAVAGSRIFSGGPELSGFGHWLVCSGGFWEASFSSTGTGLMAIGTTAVGTNVRLEVAGGALRLSQQSASLAGEIQFAELLSQGTNTVAFRAPGTLGASLTWVLPSTAGASGEQLTLGSGGTTYWGSAAGGGITYPLLSTTLGSVGTPVFSFSADSDTGIFSPGTGTLAFTTNGTNRVNIDSSGNVGIGVSVPYVPLHVRKDGSVIGGNFVGVAQFTIGDGSKGIDLGYDSTANVSIIGAENQNDIAFWTDKSTVWGERMRITSGGSVGVGTPTPSALFDVAGASRSTSSILAGAGTLTLLPPLSGTTSLRFPSNAGTAGQVLFTNGTSQLSWVTAPVNGGTFLAADGTAGAPGFAFNSDPDTGIYSIGANTLGISTAGTLRVSIDNLGNVGVGTVSPGSKLDIQGTLRISGATSGYVGFAPAPAAGNTTYTFPVTDGGVGQMLATNGAGSLSWAPAGSALTHFTESVNSTGVNAARPVVVLTATNALGTVDIALVPKGISGNFGALTAQVADGAVSGGNKRGLNAVDWQTVRSAATQVASGQYSVVAGGQANITTGNSSAVAGGFSNNASGNYSAVVGGQGNIASAQYSVVAGGVNNTASAYSSAVAGGYFNTASAFSSAVAGGANNIASGQLSAVAGGEFNTASGFRATVTGGSSSTAAGWSSTAGGLQVTASTYAETAIGAFNVLLGTGTSSWVLSEPLFVVGNGTGTTARSNALTLLKNGNLGLGTTNIGLGNRLEVTGGAIAAGPVGGAAGQAGELRMLELLASGTNSVAFRSPDALFQNVTMTLPGTLGTSGQVLSTDGTGLLSWITASASVTYPLLSTTLGSVGTPVFSFSADSDTGIYSPGTGTLAIATNGTARIYLDSVGNVGFNTTDPDSNLSLVPQLRIISVTGDGSANASSTGRLILINNRATATTGDSLGGINFHSQNNSTGTEASIGAALEGAGGVSGFGSNIQFFTKTDNVAGQAERMRLNGNGALGIGTSNPVLPLVISSTTTGLPVAPGGGAQTAGLVRIESTAGEVLDIGANNVSPFGTWFQAHSIPNNLAQPILLNPVGGNVGVGTTTPSALFDVAGAARSSSAILAGGGTLTWLAPLAGNYSLRVPSADGTSGQVLSTNGAGTLGWVSAPVNGGTFLAADGTAGAPGFAFNSDPDTGFYRLGTSTIGISTGGTLRMAFDNSGNMGIGTDVPGARLHVSGGATAGVGNIEIDDINSPTLTLSRSDFTTIVDEALGAIQFGGYDNGANYPGIVAYASQAHTAIAAGNYLTFATVPDNTVAVQERVRITSGGSVGIGTVAPDSRLHVAGTFRAASISSTSASVTTGTMDVSTANAITTTRDCTGTATGAAGEIVLQNIRDGGSYTMVVTGTGTPQCGFNTTTTGLDAATVTYRFSPANAVRTAASHTVYTMVRVGTVIYVSWITGF